MEVVIPIKGIYRRDDIMGLRRGAIRNRISKKNRQHNGQKKKVQKDKQQSTKHTYKTKNRVTRTSLKCFDTVIMWDVSV